jgi:MoaA/NifB/PqqE/SkfB family radical SAM enzyme
MNKTFKTEKNMLDRTTIDWIITNKCNLNCYYCLMGKHKNISAEPVNVEFVKNLTGSYLFHLTGGEPFLVPNFTEVCEQLIENGQFISINTNLTRKVDSFVKNVNAENVAFINCSIHYPLRKKHMSPFLRHYRQLREAGFFVFATVVMVPEIFDELECFWKTYSPEIDILPKIMRGTSDGKLYPEHYTNTQKALIREMTLSANPKLSAIDKLRYDVLCRKSVSMDDWETGIIPGGNEICMNGYSLIRITESGDIVYCKNKKIGNIHVDGLQITKKMQSCQYRMSSKNSRYTCNLLQ